MTKPASVFSSAERGSKLNEPTKTRAPSTANVFACRLEPELPNAPGACFGRSSPCRRISWSSMPACSSALRHFA